MSKTKLFLTFLSVNLISNLLFPILIYLVALYLKIDSLVWLILIIPLVVNYMLCRKGKFNNVYILLSIIFIPLSYFSFYFGLNYLTILALKNATFF